MALHADDDWLAFMPPEMQAQLASLMGTDPGTGGGASNAPPVGPTPSGGSGDPTLDWGDFGPNEIGGLDPFAGFGQTVASAMGQFNPNSDLMGNLWGGGQFGADAFGVELGPFGAVNPNSDLQSNLWNVAQWGLENDIFGSAGQSMGDVSNFMSGAASGAGDFMSGISENIGQFASSLNQLSSDLFSDVNAKVMTSDDWLQGLWESAVETPGGAGDPGIGLGASSPDLVSTNVPAEGPAAQGNIGVGLGAEGIDPGGADLAAVVTSTEEAIALPTVAEATEAGAEALAALLL